MPKIARIFIKTGLLFFLASLLAGIALEVDSWSFPALMPLFWHMLMVGWITQIIFGVSIWMFPGRTRDKGFRVYYWSWLTYILLNTGLALRIIAEPLIALSGHEFWDILAVLSAAFQCASGITYIIDMWPRIQSKEQLIKNRKKRSAG